MEMQRIALYARVSSRQQTQERSIETQIAALRDYARTHHYDVDEDLIFLDDGVSGSTLERPGLDALRDQALRGQIDQILILCPDRLARKHTHQLLVIEEFQRLGVDIIFTNRPLSETPEDHLLLQIQGIIAEYEREKIKERSRRGKLYKANAGSVNVLSGAPYGYLYIAKSDSQDARYEIHPQEAQVVRLIFDLYTRKYKSIGAIARQLTEEQIPSRTDKGSWERSVVWGVLRNPASMGNAAFRKTRQVQREKMTKQSRDRGGYPKHALSSSRDRPQEDWLFIDVPAIIDELTFAKAREQLQENKTLSPRNNKKNHDLLSGLLSCKRCGYALYGKPASNSRYKRCYYRCAGQDGYRWPTGRVCDAQPVRVEVLDELVWQNVEHLIQDPQLVLQAYTQRVGAKQKQRLSLEQLLTKKQQEIRRQEVQKQRLLDLYQAGSISLEEIQARLEQIRARIQQIQQEYKLLQQEKEQQFRQLQLIEQFETFQHKLNTNLNNLEFDQKKALVRLFVKEVIVDAVSEEIIIRHTLPLDKNTPSDHSGNVGRSEGETQHDDQNNTRLEISEDIENKGRFKEALQKSFPLCTGSTEPFVGKHRP
jgi:site-specific DNA recombinase